MDIERPELPRSLEELKRPSREEAEEAVRQVERDIEQAKRNRRGKLLNFDQELETTVIGPGMDPDMLKIRVGGDECLIRRELTLPPTPSRWPTAEELKAARALEPDPKEVIRALRERLPLGDPGVHYIRSQIK